MQKAAPIPYFDVGLFYSFPRGVSRSEYVLHHIAILKRCVCAILAYISFIPGSKYCRACISFPGNNLIEKLQWLFITLLVPQKIYWPLICSSFSSWEDKIHLGRGGRWPPAASALYRAGRTAGCGRTGDGVEGDSQVSQCHMTKMYKVNFTPRIRESVFRHFLLPVMVQPVGPNPLWIGVCVCV